MLLCHFVHKTTYEDFVALLSPKHLESLRQLPLPPVGAIAVIYPWEEVLDYFHEDDLLSGFAESADWRTRYGWGKFPEPASVAGERATPMIKPRGQIAVHQVFVSRDGYMTLTIFDDEEFYEAYLGPECWHNQQASTPAHV